MRTLEEREAWKLEALARRARNLDSERREVDEEIERIKRGQVERRKAEAEREAEERQDAALRQARAREGARLLRARGWCTADHDPRLWAPPAGGRWRSMAVALRAEGFGVVELPKETKTEKAARLARRVGGSGAVAK